MGNGRDAVYFAESGRKVAATDISTEAVELCKQNHTYNNLTFYAGRLPDLLQQLGSGHDSVYSRFCLHAMTEAEELETLRAAYKALKPGGRIYIECRSIDDPLARKGDVLSPTERFYGHYRRFIRRYDLESRLGDIGFSILSSIESNGLAVLGEEDPVVIRVIAERP